MQEVDEQCLVVMYDQVLKVLHTSISKLAIELIIEKLSSGKMKMKMAGPGWAGLDWTW